MHQAQLAIKRAADVVVSLALLVVLAPLLIVLAVLVRMSSPGPIFFIQERAGLQGRPFRIVKFRTMGLAKGPQAHVWTADDEARITPIGRFLRDYGLDELPQLWNILRGDMSIVGPRPPLVSQADSFTQEQRRMFDMRPGVLSLAAVKGRRAIPMGQRIAYHVEYVDKWSLWLDVSIFFRCALVVLGRRDAEESTR